MTCCDDSENCGVYFLCCLDASRDCSDSPRFCGDPLLICDDVDAGWRQITRKRGILSPCCGDCPGGSGAILEDCAISLEDRRRLSSRCRHLSRHRSHVSGGCRKYLSPCSFPQAGCSDFWIWRAIIRRSCSNMAADCRFEELLCPILEENVPGGRRAPADGEDVAASHGADRPPRTRAATTAPER